MTASEALKEQHAQIGQDVGCANWIEVTQDMIDQFAAVTHDDQWIHVDPARAKTDTPFQSTIAHGFLTLSLCSRFAYDVLPFADGQTMGINYGFDRLRFVSPVLPGQRVRGRFSLNDITRRKPCELMRRHHLTVEIEGTQSPALVADWLSLAIFSED